MSSSELPIHSQPDLNAATEDCSRWDERYENGCSPGGGKVSAWVRDLESFLPPQGDALDIACGVGRHTFWLASLGFRVHAVDISAAGLRRLRADAFRLNLGDQLYLEQADLDNWFPPSNRFNVILIVRYLNRTLWPKLAGALVEDGVLIMRSFHTDILNLRPQFHLDYLLQPGELLTEFSDWHLLAYEERRWQDSRSTADDCTTSIFLQKPR